MNKDTLFLAPERSSSFVFDAGVADVFDDMVTRSVPFYDEQQRSVVEIAKRFWRPGTMVYDLGCSTATTIIALAKELPEDARFVGYDVSPPMLERARQKLEAAGLEKRVELQQTDIVKSAPMANASIVMALWTLQFVAPDQREGVMRRVHDGMVDGGVLIVGEKRETGSDRLNDFFRDAYEDYKRRQGYSDVEIERKRTALDGVLIPLTDAENVEMLRRSGFTVVEPFFQWFTFNAFLCLK